MRFTDNGRDWFGNDLPPDELNVITQGGQHFGYPFCHGGNLQDDQFASRPCSEFEPPFQNLGPHVAALGVEFVPEGALAEEYQNVVFIVEHGSWNRTPATGYRVSMVDRDEGGYVPFLDGFLTESGDVLGRPVDIEFLPD